MLRLRRYRIFWILAVFVIVGLYHFNLFRDSTTEDANSIKGLRSPEFQRHRGNVLANVPAADTPPEDTGSGPLELGSQEKDEEVEEQEVQESKSQEIVQESAPDTSDRSESPRPVAESPSISQPKKALIPPDKESKDKPVADGKFDALPTVSTSPIPIVVDTPEEPGKGRVEVSKDPSAPKIYWSKLPEHFPIPSASIIQLPTGKPIEIPKIQHVFTDESANDKISREQKLDKIKKTFEFSWAGYKAKAWMEDELSPVSGKPRNPFCGWAATLVDTLDTLWMMDLKEEFEEAVNSVKDIDFTTTDRKDIPLFETVIRYLGGLLSAYDLSGGMYRVLLDKAVELAEVLMGAFDTPNRMPIAYYYWRPAFASQPHRARTRTVLAELGSLSVEFTRLAQLTKEPKYYDAIARITIEFAAWQNNTKLPGLWPMKVDASGCKKPDISSALTLQSGSSDASGSEISSSYSDSNLGSRRAEIGQIEDGNGQAAKNYVSERTSIKHGDDVNPSNATTSRVIPMEDDLLHSDGGKIKRQLAEEEIFKGTRATKVDATLSKVAPMEDDLLHSNGDKIKRQLAEEDTFKGARAPKADATASKVATIEDDLLHSDGGKIKKQLAEEDTSEDTRTIKVDANDMPACEPQGLASPPNSSIEDFTIGGQADSVYEYLPKEYMLLGGLEDVYRRMYELAVETTKKHLLFRPMIPEERSVLLSGILRTSGHLDDPNDLSLNPEGSHLACFAGGMFAIGAKIFNREGDMDTARKLTDGCVWAYEATTTGIMPERYLAVPCQDQDQCTWNETLYYHTLHAIPDSSEGHLKASKQAVLDDKKSDSTQKGVTEGDQSQEAEESKPSKNDIDAEEAEPSLIEASATKETSLGKRQLADFGNEKPMEPGRKSAGTEIDETLPAEIGVDKEESDETGKPEGKTQEAEQISEEKATSKGGAGETDTPPPTPTLQESSEAGKDKILPIGMTKVISSSYILRPEAIESIFIMYRITGDNYWREKGWAMFEAIKKHTASTYGASGIKDVTSAIPEYTDMMESFWLAETLKYFYLLFSDPGVISLDDYVFNTEAHPFKRPK